MKKIIIGVFICYTNMFAAMNFDTNITWTATEGYEISGQKTIFELGEYKPNQPINEELKIVGQGIIKNSFFDSGASLIIQGLRTITMMPGTVPSGLDFKNQNNSSVNGLQVDISEIRITNVTYTPTPIENIVGAPIAFVNQATGRPQQVDKIVVEFEIRIKLSGTVTTSELARANLKSIESLIENYLKEGSGF